MKHLKVLSIIRRNLRVVKRYLGGSKRRKILAISLTALITLTSLRFIFFSPKDVKAATLSLSTTATTVQIDVPNRYRAIMNTGDTDNFIIFYDRAENDSSPDGVFGLRSMIAIEEGTVYWLQWHALRKTTILESTPTRVIIKVEGCLDTSAGGSCLRDAGSNDTIEVAETYTFTTEGVYINQEADFKDDGLVLDNTGSSDFVYPINSIFNEWVSTAHSETLLYGDGESESSISVDGGMDGDDDLYYVAQGTGTYQDIFIGTMHLDGDKQLSNSTNGGNWYDVDVSGEHDNLIVLDLYTQTLKGKGSAQFFVLFKPQSELNTEAEREALFNDLTNPDYLGNTIGDVWDDKPHGDFIFANGFEGGDSNLCDGGDDWTNGQCESGDTAVGNESTTVYDGNYAAKFTLGGTNNSARVDKDLGRGYRTLYTRMYFLLDYEDLTVGDAFSLIYFQDSTAWQTNQLALRQDSSGSYELGVSDTNQTGTWSGSDSFIQLDTWHSIETKIYRHATAGTFDIWLDGNLVLSATSQDTGDTDIDWVMPGIINANTMNIQAFFDNVIVSESYIGTAHFNETEGAYTTDMAVSDVETDIDGGSNASTLINDATNVEAGATSITVDSTSGFPSFGVAYIEGDKFSYTGITGTSFTGIAGSGELSIIGHADNSVVSLTQRHTPLYKLRNYRKSDVPQNVTLEKDTLTYGSQYNAAIKPFTTSYFAQDLTWYSTLESSSAATSPNVGSGDAVYGTTTFTTGKYGNGALFDADEERIGIPTTGGDSANFNKDKGTIEFWYKPLHAHTDNIEHVFSLMYVDANNSFRLRKNSSNQLEILFNDNGTWKSTYVASSNYSWSAGDWVHLRFTWDKDASAGETMRIFINGTEPTHTTDTDYTGSFTGGAVLTISVFNAGVHADGIIDEFRIYNTALGPDPISKGGNAADADEYLADSTNNYTLDFNDDDANNRGEYIWLGSDSPFAGVNMDLATNGAGSSPDFDWEYWNGTAWSALTVSEQDTGSSSFTGDGNFYFTPPGNWFPYSVNGSTDLYFLRGHLEGGTLTTDPVENRIQTDILLIHYQDKLTDEDQSLIIPAISSGPNPPVAYWNMDEGYGTTANDASNHSNSATLYNGATWKTEDLCYSGKCLYFTGSSDQHLLNYKPRGVPTAYTLSTWLRGDATDQIAENIYILGWDSYISLTLQDSSQNPRGGILIRNEADSNYHEVWDSVNLLDNKWHQLSATVDRTSMEVNIYIDGELNYTEGIPDHWTGFRYLNVGAWTSTYGNFTGFLDEAKIYGYARSADEIKSDFQRDSAVRGASTSFGDDKTFLSEGLVGYWRMDENTGQNINDASGNGNTGTLGADANAGSDDMTWTNGKYGPGLTSDGVADYAKIPDNDSLDVQTGDMAVSAWFYTNGDHNSFIVAKDTCGNVNDWLIGVEANGQTHFRLIGDTDVSIYHGTGSINQWHQVVGVKNGTTMQIYFDGVLKNWDTAPTGLSGNNIPVYIAARGGSIGNPAGCGYPLPGAVDEVRIYKRALTPSEIEGLYNWGPRPVGYWKMDENTGTSTTYDSSGNSNNGSMQGGMTEANWVPGKYGSGLHFDGSGDRIDITDIEFTSGKPWTFSHWMYWGGLAGQNNRVITGRSFGDTQPFIDVGANQFPGSEFMFRNENATYLTFVDSSAYVNTWTYVTWVADDSDNVSLYINGNHAETNDVTTSAMRFWEIGRGYPNDNITFNGILDDVRIYNYARTPSQIIEDMNAGHPAPGSPIGSPVGYWQFDEGYGDTSNDVSLQGNDGDLGGTGQTCPAAGTVPCPSWTSSGKFSGSLDFDGTDDYLDVPDSPSLDITGDITITAWIKPDIQGSSADLRIVTKMASENSDGYDMMLWDGYLNMMINSTWDRTSSQFTYPIGEWAHVAFVKSGTNAKTYKNGILDTTWSDAPATINTNAIALRIGGKFGYEFDGHIDEVKVYNIALTPDQVKADMNYSSASSFGNVADQGNEGFGGNPPVGWWKMDENTGTGSNAVKDTSGNNNHGTMETSMTEDDWVPIASAPAGANGLSGSALDFDGNNDYVDLGTPTNLGLTGDAAYTLSLWAKPSATRLDGSFVSYGNAGANQVISINSTGSGAIYSVHYSNDHSFSTTWALGEWQHVVLTYNPATSIEKLYVNGVYKEQWTPTNLSLASGHSMRIGRATWNGTYVNTTQIDDVRLYTYELSASQVAYDYNRGGPVGYWALDECSGTVANDSGSGGNNGTINAGDTSGNNDSAGTCNSSASDPTNEMWNAGTTGKRNASLDFDGTNDLVTVTDNSDLEPANEMSVSAWVKFDQLSTAKGEFPNFVIKRHDSSPWDSYKLLQEYVYSEETFTFCWRNSSQTIYCSAIDANGQLATDTWYHVVGVKESGRVTIYLNGKNNTHYENTPTDTIFNSDSTLNIGANASSQDRTDGQIDEVKIYNYALTADQVKKDFNTGAQFFGPATGSP